MVIFLAVIVLIGLILLIKSIIETNTLNITEDYLSDDNNTNLKILFFSDLHMSFCFISVNKITSIIQSAKPDVIIFGGDAINKKKHSTKAIKYLKQIKDTAERLDIPFMGVTGNHDYKEGFGEALFNEAGIDLIDSKNIILEKNGCKYLITGIGDSGRANRIWYKIPNSIDNADRRVLIVHNPDYILNIDYENENDKKIDYMISGHIHGGQIRTPINFEFNVLRKDILPKKGYIAGKYTYDGKKIFISRGIGCILFPFRLGATPEVNIINI